MMLARDISKRSPAKGYEVEWHETRGVTGAAIKAAGYENEGAAYFMDKLGSTRRRFAKKADAVRFARQIHRRGGDAFGCPMVTAYHDAPDPYEPFLARREYGESIEVSES